MIGRTKVVALTGQSGCGKSTVAEYYRSQGYTVLDADRVAAWVLTQDPACLQALCEAFGQDIVDEQGVLRRRLLADRAFSAPEGQKKLTAITHPYIIRTLLEKLTQASQKGETLVFVDGAVIVGESFEAHCDKIVVVDAPLEQQVERLCSRDNITPQQAKLRISAQLPKTALYQAADAVVLNDGATQQLLERAQKVLLGLETGE